jgi:hypothetical protein
MVPFCYRDVLLTDTIPGRPAMLKSAVRQVARRAVKRLAPSNGQSVSVLSGPSPAVRDDPAKLIDRTYIANRGTRWERNAYHQLAAHIKRDAIEERRRLGERYLQMHADDADAAAVSIDKRTGHGGADLSGNPLVQAAIDEAHRVIATKDPAACPSRGSLIFLASSQEDFGDDSALTRLALSPLLVRPIAEYFGMLPILWGFDINRAASDDLIETSSHMYHFDPEDLSQIKIFIHLNDVNEQGRPFTALPADLSATAAERLTYAIGRLTDEQVHSVIGSGHERSFLGPTGFAAICDTTRCLHYGGRPGRNTRDLLVLYYSVPTTTWLPLYPGDGEPRILTPLLHPVEGDPFSAPLLGRALV